MKGVIAQIQDEDPGYNPLVSACHDAGIDPALASACANYLAADGYFGPYSVEEWVETFVSDPAPNNMPQTRNGCLEVLSAVAASVQDYVYSDYVDENCDEMIEVGRVDSRAIVADMFSAVIEVYGRGIV
jgi:hypothetical protein